MQQTEATARQFGGSSVRPCRALRFLPYCRGCPAVAAGSNGGNFYSADPQCWKEIA